jgi:NAD(P)-dependent dehydrogenase (short-subunit alcohol dehydrogenase family)
MDPSFTAELFSVAGRTVLITGGGGGIGRLLAKSYLDAGARVYITGRKQEGLEASRRALGDPTELRLLVGDLATQQGLRAILDGFNAAEPTLDVLVNNAGRTWGAPFETFPDAAWQNVMAVNVHAPFALVQGFLPRLEAAGTEEHPARVINIGSVYAATTEVMNAYSYTASKAALHQLTRVLARELASRHILVNAIAPGLFPSHMTEFVLGDPALRDATLAAIPRRRAGTREDIGGLAIFLSSRASAYITGAIIPLDGGLLIQH